MKADLARIPGKTALVVTLFIAFLVVNLLTAERSPVVWQDEVMFLDPAVNLYQGHGFTSTAWFQSRDQFFAGNAPLYSMVLYPWISIFGLHVTAIRSLNYIIMVGVISVLWIGLRKMDLVRTGRARLLFAALVLCGDGVTFSYRSGRYDCLGMLIISGIFKALAIERRAVRCTVIFLLALLIPWAGLQLIVYTALMSMVLLMIRGRQSALEIVVVIAGGFLGSASLAAYFMIHGAWPDFLQSVSLLSGSHRTITQRFANALIAPAIEPSAAVLLATLSLLTVASIRRHESRLRSATTIGVLIGLAIPCTMAFSGKYEKYYSWMAFIPMAVALTSRFEQLSTGKLLRTATIALAVLTCAVGLPARLTVTWLEWDLRDAEPVRAFVASQIRPTDWVFSVYEAYYGAKESAEVVMLPYYIGQLSEGEVYAKPITESERDRVNVLITKPDCEEKTLRFFGGHWRRVAYFQADPTQRLSLLAKLNFGSKPYTLIVYRRINVLAVID